MPAKPPARRRQDRTTAITQEEAVREILRWKAEYPDVAPEVTAIWLFRQIDSWEEHRAILKALDEVLAQDSMEG